MKILFTNDDGYDAIGIQTLYKQFRNDPKYESYLCAPLTPKSAFSHAINCYDPLELQKLSGDVQGYALDGTPADCTRAALDGLFDFPFDLVLSGINYGVNAAQDIFYSGTVGAAREATFYKMMGVAFSLDVKDSEGHIVNEEIQELFTYAAKMAKKIVNNFPQEIMQYKESIININFPSQIPAKGIKLTCLGFHEYETECRYSTKDNKDYITLKTVNKNPGTGEGTDVYHLNEGYIVVTALHKGIVFDEILQKKLIFVEDISPEV